MFSPALGVKSMDVKQFELIRVELKNEHREKM
jgi:hypothetical protein